MDIDSALRKVIGRLGTPPEERPLCLHPTVATVTRCAVDTRQLLRALAEAGWEAYSTGGNVIYIRTNNGPGVPQRREHPVPCKYSTTHRPHQTINHDAICDAHRGAAARFGRGQTA